MNNSKKETALNKSIFSGCKTFWCKLKKGLGWVSEHVPGLVGEIAGLAAAGMDALGVEGKITDPSLTPSEQTILSNWDDNYLTPFSLKLFAIFNSNIFNNSLAINTRLQFANDFILRVEAFKRYYKTNEKLGLSANAIAFRERYILEYFKPFIEKLLNELTFPDAQIISVQDEVENNDITPVIIKTTDFSEIMTFSANVFDINGNVDQITPSPQTQANHQPDVITVVTDNGTVLTSNEPVTTPKTTPKSNDFIKIIGFVTLSAIALDYAFKSSDPD